MPHGPLRHLVLAAALALGLLVSASAQQAQPGASNEPKAAPPAGFVAPADPKPDESNAARAKTQPGNNAPFWRSVRNSGNDKGFTSLPGAEQGTLVQRFIQYPGSRFTTAGEAWREVRNRWIIPYGGSLLLIALVAIGLHYWRVGALGGDHANTQGRIERFTPFERSAHWVNAIAFVILAVSGIVIAFGKFFLLPVLGLTLFGWLTYALKTVHNLAGPLFAVSLLVVFFTFLRDELPRAGDMAWIKSGGGLLGGHPPPSNRFNAGEKILFWAGMVVLGSLAVGSGLVLDKVLPGLDYARGDMQVAHMVHAVATVLMMAMLLGHIYLGTVGMKGAYTAMRHGYVDDHWAQEHHELWYRDIKAGRIPAQRSGKGAPPVVAAPRAQT
jgi:formate dehydrogenase subunit gamma